MARQHRIQYPGAWYHVTHRGAGRQDIYKNDIDRQVFLKQIAETSERHTLEVHAFCLMTNHYHLLVRTPNANLSTAMRHLNSTYTQRFNRAHQTDGAVFKGRYAAQLVGEDDYLLSVVRYLHLNPARAGLESEIGKYRWSSLAAYLQLKRPPAWLDMTWINRRFSDVAQFRRFIQSGLGAVIEEKPEFDESKLILGSPEFCRDILSGAHGSIETQASLNSSTPKLDFNSISHAVMISARCTEQEVLKTKPGQRSIPRLVALSLASEFTDLSRSDLALIFGFESRRGVSTALQLVSQLKNQDTDVRHLYAEATRRLASESNPIGHLSTETGT